MFKPRVAVASSSTTQTAPPATRAVVVNRVYTPTKCHGGVSAVKMSQHQVELLNLLPTYGHRSKLNGVNLVKTSDCDQIRINSENCLKVLTSTNRAGNANYPFCCKAVSPFPCHSATISCESILTLLLFIKSSATKTS